MTYPNPPNFTTPSDDDAWWYVRYANPDGSMAATYCYTGGRAFVDILQMMLGVTSDGRWGASTSIALASALTNVGGSSVLVGGVRADAANRRLTVNSLRGAAFLMHRSQSFGGGVPIGIDESMIVFPAETVPPTWDTAAPAGPSGDILPSCFQQQATSQPQPAPTPDQQQTPLPTDQGQPQSPSDQGPIAQPGPQPGPNYPTVVPPDATGMQTAPTGVSWEAMVIGGVALVTAAGIGYAAWQASKAVEKPVHKTPPPLRSTLRANPNPYRAERAQFLKSHNDRLLGREAHHEIREVAGKFVLSGSQTDAVKAAVDGGFDLTSRPSGNGLLWHLRLHAPRSTGKRSEFATRAAGRRLERSGFRELPAGEFNIVIRKKPA